MKKKKLKKENMEKIDITRCLSKKKQDQKNIKKIIMRLKKSQYEIINNDLIVF